MTENELFAFTAPDYDKMCAPFTYGDYTYATNGHIIVRVPKLADVLQWEAVNEKAAANFARLDYRALETALVDIPDFPQPEPAKCSVCYGTGKTSRCPECEGEGEVELGNDFNDYEVVCKTCDGDGRVPGVEAICPQCNGLGTQRVTEKIPVGDCLFSSHYLTLLKALPGIKIAPTQPEAANYFKWDAGDGLLMPMRP